MLRSPLADLELMREQGYTVLRARVLTCERTPLLAMHMHLPLLMEKDGLIH